MLLCGASLKNQWTVGTRLLIPSLQRGAGIKTGIRGEEAEIPGSEAYQRFGRNN